MKYLFQIIVFVIFSNTIFAQTINQFGIPFYNSQSQSQLQTQWENIGPKNFPINQGRLDCIWVQPNNRNTIIVGSLGGGLFKTIDGGANWKNVTDGIPAMGFNKIVYDNANNQLIASSYVNTGRNEYDQYGVGLIYSNDLGDTWQMDEDFYSFYQTIENWTLPYINDLKISAYTNEIYVVLNKFIFKRTQGNWINITPSYFNYNNNTGLLYDRNIFTDIEIPDNNTLAVGTYTNLGGSTTLHPVSAQFFISINNGTTWIDKSSDLVYSNENFITNTNFDSDISGWTNTISSISTNTWEYFTVGSISQSARCYPENNKYNHLLHYGAKKYIFSPGTRYTLNFDYQLQAHTKLKIHISQRTSSSAISDTEWYTINPNSEIILEYPSTGFATNSISQSVSLVLDEIINSQPDFFYSFYFEAVHDVSVNTGTDYVDLDNIFLEGKTLSNIKSATSADNKLYVLYDAVYSTQNIAKYESNNIIGGPLSTNQIISENGVGDIRCSNTSNKIFGLTTTFLVSDNGGANFIETFDYNTQPNAPAHVDNRDLLVYYDNVNNVEYIYRADDGGISYSTDDGYSYIHLNGNGLILTQFYGLSDLEDEDQWVYGGAQDNGTYKFKNQNHSVYIDGDGYEPEAFKENNGTKVYYQSGSGNTGPADAKLKLSNNENPYNGFDKSPSGSQNEIQRYSKPIYAHPYNGKIYVGYSNLYYNDLGGGSSSYLKYDIVAKLNSDNSPLSPITCFDISDELDINSKPSNIYIAIDGLIDYNLIIEEKRDRLLKIVNENIQPYNPIISNITGNLPVNNYTLSSVISDPKNHNRVWVGLSQFPRIQINDIWKLNPGHERIYYKDVSTSNNWIDVSTGLPPFSINCMIYQKGSDDIIYAGTDVGVFVFNKLENKWETFNKDMVCHIKDLEINYCTGKLRAATWGRGIWEADLINHVDLVKPLEIATNTTWSSDLSLLFNITIKPNATLTIQNSLVNISANRKITIEPSGRLILDNSTLTNQCGQLWQGIEVQGNWISNQPSIAIASASVYPPVGTNAADYPGVCIIKNNSEINHAEYGVINTKIEEKDTYSEYAGGLIIASNSTFLDNRIAAGFYRYVQAKDLSRFTNCNFINTQNNIDENINSEELVHIEENDGVRFIACHFEDQSNNPASYILTGIQAFDAAFTVNGDCNSLGQQSGCNNCETLTRSTFTNLYYGIQIKSSIPDWPTNTLTTIHWSDFIGCQRAMLLSGISNKLKITYNKIVNIPSLGYGTYLEGCHGFILEDNSYDGLQSAIKNTGVYIHNCFGDDLTHYDRIYRNNFSSLDVGVGAIGDNDLDHFEAYDGLEILCNNFSHIINKNIAVFAVYDNNNNLIETGAIRKFQGTSNYAAGNQFSTGNSSHFWIDNNAEPVHYYYNNSSSYIPLNYTGSFYPIITTSAPSCVATPCGGSGGGSNYIANRTGNIVLMKNLFDGGDREQLIQKIKSAAVTSAELKNYLIIAGPYLTDTVLMESIERQYPFVNADIKAVMVNNSPLSDSVYQKLSETKPTVANNLTVIGAQFPPQSQRDVLESSIANEYSKIDLSISDKINYFIDQLESPIDSIKNYLQEIGYEQRIIPYLIKEGNNSQASNLISQINASNNQQQMIKDLYEIKLTSFANKEMPDSIDKTVLNTISNSTHTANFFADNWLEYLTGLNTPEYIPIEMQAASREIENQFTVINNSFQLYPNPAKNEVNIVIENDCLSDKGNIEIYTITGVLIKSIPTYNIHNTYQINIENLSSGNYYCKYISDINCSTVKRFVVERE